MQYVCLSSSLFSREFTASQRTTFPACDDERIDDRSELIPRLFHFAVSKTDLQLFVRSFVLPFFNWEYFVGLVLAAAAAP